MKKRLGIFLLAGMLVFGFTACGNQNGESKEDTTVSEEATGEAAADAEGVEAENFTEDQYLSHYQASDYVTLSEYRGVQIDVDDEVPEITEEDLQKYIDDFLSHNTITKTVDDRAVQEGDTVNIDYLGKVDGVAFDGGAANGYNLTIGSHTFIEGFEDGCIGMKVGETRDVETKFPDPYPNNSDLAGKVAIFTVTVNSITVSELPELTDDFILEQEIEGVSTVDEYREYAKDELRQKLIDAINDEKMDAAWQAVEALCEFKEPPTPIVDRMNDTLTSNIGSLVAMYGMDIGEYVAYVYGGEAADYEATLRSSATQMAKDYMMLQAIADLEDLNVTDQEFEEAIEEDAKTYGQPVEDYKVMIDAEAYKEYLMTQKVIHFLGENAITAH